MGLARLSGLVAALMLSTAVLAGEADVIAASVSQQGDGLFRFDVTIRSNDTGWDHYCDRFDVVAPDGSILGTRILVHPHETEQPFTRSLAGVAIPDGVGKVTVRAAMKPSGEGGKVVEVRVR